MGLSPTGSGGISNSASANVITKSNGTNLVASRITDDGTALTATSRDVQIGDPLGDFNGTYLLLDDTLKIAQLRADNNGTTAALNLQGGAGGTAQLADGGGRSLALGPSTVSLQGGVNVGAITLTSATPAWTIGAGASSTGITINGSGTPFISLDSGAGATSLGDINSTANSTFVILDDSLKSIQVAADASTGVISLTASAVNVNSHSIGATLAVPVSNTVLAQATGTVYSSPGYVGTPLAAATEGAVSWPCPRAGVIKNLFVRTGTTAKTNTPATTITIRKNGADTAVTLTMTETTSTTSSDLIHSVSVAQGDLITVSFAVTGAAAVSTSIAGISFELQ